ncbi:hypothetical protein BH10CYA1_BH10CYA1_51810 [soil metagenome]
MGPIKHHEFVALLRIWNCEELLSDAYEAFHKGRVPKDKSGRPSKDTVALNTDVKSDTKETIGDLAKSIGCSQGEVIDFLALYYVKINDVGHQMHEEEERLGLSETVMVLMKSVEDMVKQVKSENKIAKRKARLAKRPDGLIRRNA